MDKDIYCSNLNCPVRHRCKHRITFSQISNMAKGEQVILKDMAATCRQYIGCLANQIGRGDK